MNTIWKSNLGKLLLGGCGTQLGLVVASTALVGILLFCFVCALTNVLSISVVQEMVSLSTYAAAEAVSNEEVETLRGEIDSLVSEVEVLRANGTEMPLPSAPPAPASASLTNPFVIARQSGINLRSGPGVNYNRVGTLQLGDVLEIEGRNSDSSWWLIATPSGLAWVSAEVVVAYNLHDDIPVVSIPALLVWPSAPFPADPPPAPTNTPTPKAPANSSQNHPRGTPTATATESRIFVEDTVGYKRLWEQLSAPPNSASFSPQGERIAVIEGIKVYLVAGDASYGQILLAEDESRRPIGDAVWSPDGRFLAFSVDYKSPKCKPCRSVAVADLEDDTIFFLETPDNMDSAGPRWTQDGRMLVNVYPKEPADGATYIYETSGRGKVATGIYVLSSSHEGQKWLPWRPGRIWRAGVSERPDTYYRD